MKNKTKKWAQTTHKIISQFAILALALCASFVPSMASAQSRIKDLIQVEGVRENQLIGYGIVVGLQGTGDGLRNSPFTRQTIEAMLERMGVNTRDQALQTKNIAGVMVTATLPPFSTQGSTIDVTVSALGDAKSLSGGTLVVTPLMGADGQVYAVAQGQLTVGGFVATGGSGSNVGRGVPTNGRVANGATIERELRFDLANMTEVRFALRNPDFTTARRIAGAINQNLGVAAASVDNPSTVILSKPIGYPGDMVNLITRIERLNVTPDTIAKIVVDESSGIVVMGENVRVSTVAVAQGNLTISVQEDPFVSQPAPFSRGETVSGTRSAVSVEEDENITSAQNCGCATS
ncbi:MAG: flgI [Hyphomonadaceae bacterium]|nr:MAG: flgI [Hyphomonadaceae bacterium]